MKPIHWNLAKSLILANARGVSFEAIVVAIESGGLLDILEHPNKIQYPHQRILVVRYKGYVYLVPYVEEDAHLFLKTIIPSRKATKQYLYSGKTPMSRLDIEEQQLLAAYEAGQFRSVASESELARIQAAARATGTKDKRVNIRLSSSDLYGLQARALEQGIPYQTLIASILHKYVSGRLREADS